MIVDYPYCLCPPSEYDSEEYQFHLSTCHLSKTKNGFEEKIMNQQDKVKAIARILKGKFTNLTVEDTIDLAYKILEAIGDDNAGKSC